MDFNELRGRYDFRHRVVSFVGPPAEEILPADSRRVCILFQSLSGVNPFVVSPVTSLGTGSGLNVPQTYGQILELWFPRHGILPMLSWIGETIGGANDIYIVEVLYNPD